MRGLNRELELSLKREIYKNSYHEYFKFCFKILFPSEAYEDSLHIEYLCGFLQKEVERMLRREEKDKDIIVNLPPRASKSLLFNCFLTSYVWIKDPTIPFIVISFDDKLSLMNAKYSRDIIKSEEFQELFGDIFQLRKDVDATGLYQNDKGGFRLSSTSGSSITGHKGAIIIADDIQNPKTAEQEVEREKVIEFWEKSLFNRLTPINLGFRINIQQRLAPQDVTGHLLEKNPEDFNLICLPAELADNVHPPELKRLYTDGLLDPRRLSRKILDIFKKVLGTRSYAGQYSQKPNPESGNILKGEWFDIVNAIDLRRDITNSAIMFFIDGAYTKKTENDPSAILACFKENNILYITDVIEVWLEFPELCKFIHEYAMRNGYNSYSKIFIEPKASGLSVTQQLRTATNLNVIEAPNPEADKVTRAHAVAPTLESRKVRLVSGIYIKEFVEQLEAFPNGTHDDKVDTLVMSVNQMLIEGSSPDFLFLD